MESVDKDLLLSIFRDQVSSIIQWNWYREAEWPIGYGVGLRIKRSSVRIRPWPLRWVLGQGSLLPLSQGEAFTLAFISYLAILVKIYTGKKKKIENTLFPENKISDLNLFVLPFFFFCLFSADQHGLAFSDESWLQCQAMPWAWPGIFRHSYHEHNAYGQQWRWKSRFWGCKGFHQLELRMLIGCECSSFTIKLCRVSKRFFFDYAVSWNCSFFSSWAIKQEKCLYMYFKKRITVPWFLSEVSKSVCFSKVYEINKNNED